MKLRRVLPIAVVFFGLLLMADPELSQPKAESQAATSHQVLYTLTAEGQLLKSGNRGQDWSQLDGPGSRVTALAVASDQVLYVGTESLGVFKSTDGGLTWQAANHGLGLVPGSRLMVTDLTLDPQDPRVVYVTTAYLFGSTQIHVAPLGVAVSRDGGASWAPVSTEGQRINE